MIEQLMKKLMKDVKETSILAQSKRLDVPYATLHRIVNKKSSGSIRTWEQIRKHYRNHDDNQVHVAYTSNIIG